MHLRHPEKHRSNARIAPAPPRAGRELSGPAAQQIPQSVYHVLSLSRWDVLRELLGRLPGRVEAISRYEAHRATAIARNLRRGSVLFPQAIAARLGERAPSGSRVIEILPTNAGVALRTRPRGGKRCVWARQAIVVTPACAGHVHRRKTRRTTSRLSPCRCLTAAIPAN